MIDETYETNHTHYYCAKDHCVSEAVIDERRSSRHSHRNLNVGRKEVDSDALKVDVQRSRKEAHAVGHGATNRQRKEEDGVGHGAEFHHC